jgi:hypothetical protein
MTTLDTRTLGIELLVMAADMIDRAPLLAKGTYEASRSQLDENGRLLRGTRRVHTPTCYCAIGAIEKAAELTESPHTVRARAVIRLAEAIEGAAPSGWFAAAVIQGWNDAPVRTKDEVVAMLRAAAGVVRA